MEAGRGDDASLGEEDGTEGEGGMTRDVVEDITVEERRRRKEVVVVVAVCIARGTAFNVA